MTLSKRMRIGIFGCSVGILLSWVCYIIFYHLPNLERHDLPEQQVELTTLWWHLPSILPALLGIFIFKMPFLSDRIFYLYLLSFGLFLATYGWSMIAAGAISAGIPAVLLLWPLNLFLLIDVLDQIKKRKQQRKKF